MTLDFAADLAEVFWHMTWDLCINFAMFLNKLRMTWELCADLRGRYVFIFLTDDTGIFDQIDNNLGTSRKTQTSKMGSGR